MADNQKSSLVADCLDGIVAFPAAVDQMRAANDEQELPGAMIRGTQVAFNTLDRHGGDGLLFVAAAGQDLLYRHLAGITVMDRCTRAYCSLVIRSFFDRLFERHVRTFYILDNTLRDDRLAALVELFALAGIATVTPRRDGLAWPALSTRIREYLETVGHVAYIEPDAQVNHLEAAQEMARESVCVATFRNLSPDQPQFAIVTFKAS